MPRNRVIYQVEAVYVGPTPATGTHFYTGNVNNYTGQIPTVGNPNTGNNLISQLYRIQSANYDFNLARRDVNQFGELAAIDRLILDQPSVTFTTEWIINGLYNENILGFYISTGTLVSAVSGILNKTEDEKNYFIKTHSQGVDAVGNRTDAPYNVIALGNGFITNYTAKATVGDFPRASINVEALNFQVDQISSAPGTLQLGNPSGLVAIPAVNPGDGTAISTYTYDLPAAQSSTGLAHSALKPGDITFGLTWDEGGVKISDAKIQSFTIGFDLSRTALQKLGSKYAFSREINFPASASLSITADVGDLTTGKLTEMVTNDNAYDLSISVKLPGSTVVGASWVIKNAKLDSQAFSSAIGSNKSVTLSFTSQIGGPTALTRGIFLSGVN